MDFAEHRIATTDGPFVYARDYAADAGHRLPVVCLHGLTRNSADFEAVAPRIATLGRRVIVVDARGRGKSDNDPDATRYRPDVYVGDTVRVMNTLNVPRAVFLGTSMGGLMTMLMAAAAPTRVASAVLNDIGPEIDPRGLARIRSYVGKATPFASWAEAIAAVKTTNSSAFPKADDAFWRTFAQRVARERDDGRVELAYDQRIADTFSAPQPSPPPSLLPLFEALAPVPLLVVRGALSDLLSPEGVETMRRIKPDLFYAEVPDVGHAPTLEEHEAWEAIAKFLSNVE